MADEKNLGREKLKSALALSETKYLDDNSAEECESLPSAEYLRQIRQVKRRVRAPFFSLFPTVGKRVAAAILLCVIFFGGAGAFVVTAGNPDAEIFLSKQGTGVKVTFLSGSSNIRYEGGIRIYSFSSLPEGYTFYDRLTMSRGTSIHTRWKNGNDIIWLTQDDLSVSMNFGEAEMTTHDRNGKKIVEVAMGHSTQYIWTNAKCVFTLYVTEKMTNEEIFALVETLAAEDGMP